MSEGRPVRIDLRPARPDDAVVMSRWFADLTDLQAWGGPEVVFPLTDKQLAAWIAEGANEKPRICFTSVDAGEEAVGHVEFLRDPPRRWARLGRFAVAPELRGKGFGRALFEHAMCMAFRDFDVEHLALAVMPSNERAVRLYRSCGFRDESVMPGPPGADGRSLSMTVMGLMRKDWRIRDERRPGAMGMIRRGDREG